MDLISSEFGGTVVRPGMFDMWGEDDELQDADGSSMFLNESTSTDALDDDLESLGQESHASSSNRTTSRRLPSAARVLLDQWLLINKQDPYLKPGNADALANLTGLSAQQVKTYINNARSRRSWLGEPPTGQQPDQGQQKPIVRTSSAPQFNDILQPYQPRTTYPDPTWPSSFPDTLFTSNFPPGFPLPFNPPLDLPLFPPLLPSSLSTSTIISSLSAPPIPPAFIPSPPAFTLDPPLASIPEVSSTPSLPSMILPRHPPLPPSSSPLLPPRRGRRKHRHSISSGDIPAALRADALLSWQVRREMPAGDPGRPHRCVVCGAGFRRKSDLQRHVSSIHAPREAWTCLLGGAVVEVGERMGKMSGEDGIGGKGGGGRCCVFCGEGEPTGRHLETEHRALNCAAREEGERTFVRKDKLLQHLGQVHGFAGPLNGWMMKWVRQIGGEGDGGV